MDQQLVKTALKSLDDIVLPPPVSYVPQTWGWAVVALVLLALFAAVVWRWLRYRKANRYRRAALVELRLLELGVLDGSTGADIDRQLAAILKRTALAAWPRTDVASLSGPPWARFLGDHAPGGTLDARLAELVGEQEYRQSLPEKKTQDHDDRLIAAARRWIEGHHVSA